MSIKDYSNTMDSDQIIQVFDGSHHCSPDFNFSIDYDDEYFGEGTPNETPLLDVSEKYAISIEILEDEELVSQAAEFMFPNCSEGYEKVARILFNDLSTWHIPLKSWEEDYAKIRQHIVQEYIEDIIRWRAIQRGDDPDEEVKEWDKPWEEGNREWEERLDETEISEENREWFNRYCDWLPHIDRTIESSSEDVDLDVDDESDWADDW